MMMMMHQRIQNVTYGIPCSKKKNLIPYDTGTKPIACEEVLQENKKKNNTITVSCISCDVASLRLKR